MNQALTPSLATVAARLAADAGTDPLPPDDSTVDGTAGDWRSIAVPAAAAGLFARAADSAVLAARPLGAGQIHLLPALHGGASLLLDAWLPARQCWRGWLVTPDAAYAGPTDLVIEERDAPVDGRAGLVLCEGQVEAEPARLGICIGVLSQERLAAVAWLGKHGNDGQAYPRPGVVARRAVGTDYVLTGSSLAIGDPRATYWQLVYDAALRIGLRKATDVPAVRAAGAANSPRWLKSVAAIAAGVAVLQFGWILSTPAPQEYGVAEYRGGSGRDDLPRVRVLFRGEATEQEIRSWLQREQIAIVAGPDALGAFTLQLRAGQVLPPPGPANPLARINP